VSLLNREDKISVEEVPELCPCIICEMVLGTACDAPEFETC
jgi:hypothetical protein